MKIEMAAKHFSLVLSCPLPISFHSQLFNRLRTIFTNNLQYLLQHLTSLQLGYSYFDHKEIFFTLHCPYFWFIASSGIWLGIFILKCVRAFVSLLPQIASDTWAIYYTLRSLPLSVSGLLALRPWSPILPSHRQLHAGPVWSARSPAAGIELQLTWRILVPLLAPVGLSKPPTTQPQRQRVKGWRRNCSKGPGRIFVYLLHILGFTATTTSSRFCGRYLLCLPSLPQQWHSREPQQHNSGNNNGHSYFGASAPTSAPF